MAKENWFIGMPVSEDENVLTTWSIGRELRRGILVGLLIILFSAVGILFYKYDKLQSDRAEFLEKMVEDKVNDKLDQPIRDIKRVTNKMDTVADQASDAALKVDSVLNEQIK